MANDIYLTTAEAADYLKLKERKLYELVSEGAIPCTKVTGKWLFPRASLDRWLAAGAIAPAGFSPLPPPPIVGGSHDLLLEWTIRESGAGLALLPEGSARGLERLARDEIAVAAIHFHGPADGDEPNRLRIAAEPALHDAVVIAFARREQGLVTAAGNPLGHASLADAVRARARVAPRQPRAGSHMLLESLLDQEGHTVRDLAVAGGPSPTGSELAVAIRTGRADCGLSSRSVADVSGLGFVPLVWERFDLAMRRRTYFDPPVQAVLALAREPRFRERAADLGGYDVGEVGSVLLNR